MNPDAMISGTSPFPTVAKLAAECGEAWPAYDVAAEATRAAEVVLIQALRDEAGTDRLLDADSALVLCGSFARHEMVPGSDCDWTLLINGVVSNRHADVARQICRAIEKADRDERGICAPGSSGTFGNMSFSHDLVHRIGGGADSNANLTRRILMLLESRPVSISRVDSSREVWESVVRSILERYFEEDVHFSPAATRKVPRFLLNDLTRYWRTIGVDYAAKHLEQDGKKWAIRNAKLRFSRKLLYAAGLAFCFACHLNPPEDRGDGEPDIFTLLGLVEPDPPSAAPFIASAMAFTQTPPLEFLAAFVDAFVSDPEKRKTISRRLFRTYHERLLLLGDNSRRKALESLGHDQASGDPVFQEVRRMSTEFSKGLQLLFFNRDRDIESDPIAQLSLEYVAF